MQPMAEFKTKAGGILMQVVYAQERKVQIDGIVIPPATLS